MTQKPLVVIMLVLTALEMLESGQGDRSTPPCDAASSSLQRLHVGKEPCQLLREESKPVVCISRIVLRSPRARAALSMVILCAGTLSFPLTPLQSLLAPLRLAVTTECTFRAHPLVHCAAVC